MRQSKYSEYDVRDLQEFLTAGATRTGQIERDELDICDDRIKNKPYILFNGVVLSPAVLEDKPKERGDVESASTLTNAQLAEYINSHPLFEGKVTAQTPRQELLDDFDFGFEIVSGHVVAKDERGMNW